MQQHALVGRSQFEQSAHLVRVVALDVAQATTRALLFGQPVQFAPYEVERFGREQAAFGRVDPGCGKRTQCPGQRSVAGRNRSGLTVGHRPSASRSIGDVRLSRTPRVFAMLIRTRNSQVRRLERPSKPSMPFEQREPGVLHDVLGDLARRHVAAGDARASPGCTGRRGRRRRARHLPAARRRVRRRVWSSLAPGAHRSDGVHGRTEGADVP